MSVHRLDLDTIGELVDRGLDADHLSNIFTQAGEKDQLVYVRVFDDVPVVDRILFVSNDIITKAQRDIVHAHLMNEDNWDE